MSASSSSSRSSSRSPVSTLDLRPVGLAERNTLVARKFAALAPGEALELLLDSPPWVLYHQLRTERFEEFDWELVAPGPEQFVVRLSRRP